MYRTEPASSLGDYMTCKEHTLMGFSLHQISMGDWLIGWLSMSKISIYRCHASGKYGMQASDQSRHIFVLAVAMKDNGRSAYHCMLFEM